MYNLRLTIITFLTLTLTLTLTILLAGCGEKTEEIKPEGEEAPEREEVELLPPEKPPFKSEFFPDGVWHSIPLKDIFSGGPPKDGIPALTNPQTVRASEAKYLRDSDVVLGVTFDGQSRAYPIRIMNWHEVVNDRVGNTLLLLTYCPLCGTGIAFEPIVKGERNFFGVSGLLHESNLLMYDRGTDQPSLWSQVRGEAVVGPLTGSKLKLLPIVQTTWKDWRNNHSNTEVLSLDTGFARNYNFNPYAGYDKDPELFFPVNHKDPRLPIKEWIFGIIIDKSAKAYPLEVMKNKMVVNDVLGGTNIVLIANEETGSVQVYERKNYRLKGSFDILTDEEGKTWDLTDDFLISKNGDKLRRLPGIYAFWFSWVTAYKNTELFTG